MRPEHDLTGKTFGRLVVLHKGPKLRKWGAFWICKCSCGKEKNVSASNLRGGATNSCGCLRKETCAVLNRPGKVHHCWKGGRRKMPDGYISVYAGSRKCVPEHRLIMESYMGRCLDPKETVHHKNGIRDDNRIENLELWTRQHPAGQRIADMKEWAVSFLKAHAPELLK